MPDRTPQLDLWHEAPEDALKADIWALGGPKKVARLLYPAKPVIEGGKYIDRVLDSERPEKFSLEEIMLIIEEAEKVGSRCYAAFVADRASCRLQIVSPEDRKKELLERWDAAREEISRLEREMRRTR